ncbi:hypothetical protein VTJ49DRAFT_5336 [Mycothermus thermophilus]|uniref:Uncharacterized protein n=1 Tax=Humicola insolens TaxID=85995 RepID=A0ABR3V3U5_HUMIN
MTEATINVPGQVKGCRECVRGSGGLGHVIHSRLGGKRGRCWPGLVGRLSYNRYTKIHWGGGFGCHHADDRLYRRASSLPLLQNPRFPLYVGRHQEKPSFPYPFHLQLILRRIRRLRHRHSRGLVALAQHFRVLVHAGIQPQPNSAAHHLGHLSLVDGPQAGQGRVLDAAHGRDELGDEGEVLGRQTVASAHTHLPLLTKPDDPEEQQEEEETNLVIIHRLKPQQIHHIPRRAAPPPPLLHLDRLEIPRRIHLANLPPSRHLPQVCVRRGRPLGVLGHRPRGRAAAGPGPELPQRAPPLFG